jgi:hypothetical protein
LKDGRVELEDERANLRVRVREVDRDLARLGMEELGERCEAEKPEDARSRE